jgi:hypothetical protein
MKIVVIPQYSHNHAKKKNVNTATIHGIQYSINLFIISGSGIIEAKLFESFFFSSTAQGSVLLELFARDNLI